VIKNMIIATAGVSRYEMSTDACNRLPSSGSFTVIGTAPML